MASRLTKSELIKAVSADRYGMKAEEVVAKVGGAEAFEDLIDLLQNQPDAPDQMTFGMRQNIILALGEIGDPRAIVPLLQCYELYFALIKLMVETLEEKGVSVPAQFYSQSLMEKYKNSGSPSLRGTAASEAFEKKVAGTHIRTHANDEQYAVRMLAFGWLVRIEVVRALAKIKADGMNDILANLMNQERENSAHKTIVLALGKLHDARAIEGLGQYLFDFVSATSWSPSEVQEAIGYLASYPDERAKELLRQFCERCTDGGKRELRKFAADKLDPTGKMPELAAARKGGGCFIATAAYGSDAMPQVRLLQEFRDTRLSRSRMGRAAVALYERLSPPLADWIREHPARGLIVRVVILNGVVQFLRWMRVVKQPHVR